jgi:hypothetical protein
MKMERTPPVPVRRELRKEVGFGCPVPGCGNPYLYWHHFDPPWNEREHYNPEGMIALCGEHHAKANAGAYTKEQLRDFKGNAVQHRKDIEGRFDWMRRQLLAVVGGNFYFESPIILEFKKQPVIWFNRDEDGYLLLNLRMLSTSREPRVQLEDNFWLSIGNPDDLECPPSGKLLKVTYSNGDSMKIEFFELESEAISKKLYPQATFENWGIPFPITVVEVYEKVGGTEIEFGPRETTLPGGNILRNCFFRNNRVVISIG